MAIAKRLITKFCLVLILMCVCLLPLSVQAATVTLDVEQARANLPEVRVNFYLDDASINGADVSLTKKDISATLGGEDLEVVSVDPFTFSGSSVNYYVLADVSGSITDDQMKAEKKALLDFSDGLGQKDKMILITVGETTKVILEGSESAKQRESVIIRLGNHDKTTHLYDSINAALKIADSSATSINIRNEAIIITDGAEDTDKGAYTKDVTLGKLEKGNLPIYALGFKGGNNKKELDNLFMLADASGGEMHTVESGNVGNILTKVTDKITSGYVAVLKTETNVLKNDKGKFVLKVRVGDRDIPAETSLRVISTAADTTPPKVIGKPKQLESKDGIGFNFSKPVIGADNKDAYIIKDRDGNQIEVKKAAYSKGSADTAPHAEVIFESKPYSGEYELSFIGITDVSKEQNLLKDTVFFPYNGKSGTQKAIDGILGFLQSYWWIVLLVGIAAIALLALRYIKKRHGFVMIDGKIGFGDMVEFKQHLGIPDTGDVCLIVTDTRGDSRRIDVGINHSFFVGRAGINNLSFDDDKMSRQHFVIDIEDGVYYLTDLGTTNGTYLNGVPVKGRRKIVGNDVITAGRGKFVFRIKESA